MPQCTRCQKTVLPDAERCPHCGAWLAQNDAPVQSNHDSLEDSVRSLLGQGQKIEAIQLYQRTGLGLAAAKNAVERIGRGESPAAGEAVSNEFEKQILELLSGGQKIAAVKLYREKMRTDLKQAKDAVEALGARHGMAPPAGSGCLGAVVLLVSGIALLVECSSWSG